MTVMYASGPYRRTDPRRPRGTGRSTRSTANPARCPLRGRQPGAPAVHPGHRYRHRAWCSATPPATTAELLHRSPRYRETLVDSFRDRYATDGPETRRFPLTRLQAETCEQSAPAAPHMVGPDERRHWQLGEAGRSSRPSHPVYVTNVRVMPAQASSGTASADWVVLPARMVVFRPASQPYGEKLNWAVKAGARQRK
jgi:hypothetical protein